ncbi:retrotransposon protein, putative, ty1-copia subclass [Tanacetum coccineum]
MILLSFSHIVLANDEKVPNACLTYRSGDVRDLMKRDTSDNSNKDLQEIQWEGVDLDRIQKEEDTYLLKSLATFLKRWRVLNHHNGGKEIQSMMDNMVWVLVDLPPGCKTVGSKWIFKKKTDMGGIVHIYKARLIAKGYTQFYRFDYEETFSPIADIRAIRILISIAAYYDYEIWQMDVKTAFS